MKRLRTFVDRSGMIWIIKKESIEKKRGQYTYFMADTIDGKTSLKQDTLKSILKEIKDKFGEYQK